MATSPNKVSIRSYNVGFGDCYLLSFAYGPKSERHVLIDFGSTGLPEGAPKTRMMDVALDIKARTRGKLHAVVATHRHKDHISGFETKKGGKGTGDVIASLKPNIVVQPWTEDPDLDTKAVGPASKAKGKGTKSKPAVVKKKLGMMGLDTPKQITALAHMHEIARQMTVARNLPRAFKSELSFLGETNIANLSAVKNLMNMAKNSYVFCGKKSGLEKILPGVRIHVLGPPTVAQTDTIRKQRSEDSDEFWHFQADAVRADRTGDGGTDPLFAARYVRSHGGNFPLNARWLVYHSRMTRGEQLLQIVRMLDQQMNNTSVILLFEVGKKKLLFPGDAQLENWQFALSQDKFTSLLSSVNVYKVGHHGSLNATPKSLWKLFKNKSEKKKAASRLKSLMSTMEGKHGHTTARTEVPRRTLVNALNRESDLFTTQKVKPADLHIPGDIVVTFP
jgi:hypothetical protein